MKTIKGPAVFLAQFAGGGPHLQNLNDMAKWAKECGFIGVQLPSWDGRVMDLKKAAESKTYCDELRGTMAKHGIEPTELAGASAGPAGRGASGLRPAVRQLRARRSARQSGKARQAWAVQADGIRGEGQQEPRAQERAPRSRARSPGPIYIRGRSVRRASSKPRSTSWPSAGSPSSTFSKPTGRTAASKCIRARTFSTAKPSRCFSSA